MLILTLLLLLLSRSVMSDSLTPWTVAYQAPLSMEFSRQEYWSGLPHPPPGIFPTQGSNPGLPHCRWILHHLSHHGRPRILEWVAYPFSSRSSQPRNWTGVSRITGGFFTNWAIREAHVGMDNNFILWGSKSMLLNFITQIPPAL